MKTKAKFIGILAVLGLLLAMLPAIPASGAVAGTITISGGVTNENIDWFSLETSYNKVTLTVADADENNATDLTGSCTSGALTFNCELVGVGGEGTDTANYAGKKYAVSNTPMVDRNGDDIPDAVTVRSLQAQQSFLLATASAAGGTLTLSAATSLNEYAKLAATAVSSDSIATGLTTQLNNFAMIEAAFSSIHNKDVAGTHTGAADAAVLTDALATFVVDGVQVGDTISNTTDGSTGPITALTATTITATLAGGTDNDWDASDAYTIANDLLGTNGITITGTSVNAATLVETANDTENIGVSADLGALDAADGSDDGATNIRGAKWWKTIDSFAVDHASGKFSIAINELETVASGYQYDVQDTITGKVTIVSTSAPTSVAVSVIEADSTAGKASGSFTGTVKLMDDASKNGVLCSAVEVTDATHPCTVAGEWLLFVANGDQITSSYVDASPSSTLTDTARVDLTAPVVTLVSPTESSFNNLGVPNYSVQVIDEDVAASASAGITDTDINFKLQNQGGVAGDVAETRAPITGGYQVSLLESTARPEGKLEWWVEAMDKVGNAPASTVRGASTTTPFRVTFDYTAPTLTAAETGTGLKNVGIVETETETGADNDTSKIKVSFDLGTAGVDHAGIDATTVDPNDFRVGGVAPSATVVNLAGDAIYLTVAAQTTDARPKVELTGEIADKSGNKRTSGSVTNATDKLRPVLTVNTAPSSSTTLSNDKVTITVESSETLIASPTVTTYSNDDMDEDLVALTVTSTGAKSWKATYTATASQSTKRWVTVVGTDITNSNTETVGDSTTTADVVFFQVDKLASEVTITPATVEEGSIFIHLEFDENEGEDEDSDLTADGADSAPNDDTTGGAGIDPFTDEFKKVTLTAATLTNKTTSVAEDVLAGFFTKDSIQYDLVKTLGVAKYDLKITFQDEAGNSGTKTQEISVTARVKTKIELTPGNNFVSLRGDALSAGINDIIGTGVAIDLVVGYDASLSNPWLVATRDSKTGLFVGDLTSLDAGGAYIIRATAFVDLEVDIPTPTYNQLPGVSMVTGSAWSFIGVATRTAGADVVEADSYLAGTKWSVCVTFNPDPGADDAGWSSVRPENEGDLIVDRGYFCWFQADGTIVHQ